MSSSLKIKLEDLDTNRLCNQLPKCMKLYVDSINPEDKIKLFKREKFICMILVKDDLSNDPYMYAFCHNISKVSNDNQQFIKEYLYDAPYGVVLGEMAGTDSRKYLFISDIDSTHHVFY